MVSVSWTKGGAIEQATISFGSQHAWNKDKSYLIHAPGVVKLARAQSRRLRLNNQGFRKARSQSGSSFPCKLSLKGKRLSDMTMNSIVHDIRMKLFVQQIQAPSSSSSKVGIFSLDKKPRSCDARACDGECSCGLRSKYCRLALIILKGCRRG